jgi:hypothetical protein
VPVLNGLPDTLFSQTTSSIMLDIAALVILLVRPSGLFGEAVGALP